MWCDFVPVPLRIQSRSALASLEGSHLRGCPLTLPSVLSNCYGGSRGAKNRLKFLQESQGHRAPKRSTPFGLESSGFQNRNSQSLNFPRFGWSSRSLRKPKSLQAWSLSLRKPCHACPWTLEDIISTRHPAVRSDRASVWAKHSAGPIISCASRAVNQLSWSNNPHPHVPDCTSLADWLASMTLQGPSARRNLA